MTNNCPGWRPSLALGEGLTGYQRYWVTRHYLGHCLMQMGRLDDAHNALDEAGEQLRIAGNRHFEVKARADLGLLHHLHGDDHRAQNELTEVLRLTQNHGDLRFEALVSTRLGCVFETRGQLDDAQQMYARGYELHRQMEQDYYALNALAGMARVAVRQGDDEMALAHVSTIWATIAGQETDATVETTRTLRTCHTIFDQHDDARAADILATACNQLRQRVATIDDPAQRAQFWQLADHRFFRDAEAQLRD